MLSDEEVKKQLEELPTAAQLAASKQLGAVSCKAPEPRIGGRRTERKPTLAELEGSETED